MSPSPDTRAAVNKILLVLEELQLIDKSMTVAEAFTFFVIASTGDDLSLAEIGERGGFVPSTCSRYLQALGSFDRDHKPGLELITDPVDSMDRRRRIRKLTPKGAQLVATVVDILGKRVGPALAAASLPVSPIAAGPACA